MGVKPQLSSGAILLFRCGGVPAPERIIAAADNQRRAGISQISGIWPNKKIRTPPAAAEDRTSVHRRPAPELWSCKFANTGLKRKV